jgi:hypothetical protein
VQQRESDLKAVAQPGISPQRGQALLQTFFDHVITDTEDALNGVRKVGVPDVSNGQTIANAFTDALTRAKSALERARTQVNSLPTTSGTAFRQAADQLGNQVKGSLDQIGSAFSGLQSAELEQAAKSASACKGGL